MALSAMPQGAIAPCSRRFYLAFQRYVSSTAASATRTPHNPNLYMHSRPTPHPKLPIQHLQLRHQTASASSPPKTSPKPPTHYDLFPQTLPCGPPPSGPFPINLQALKREFLQLQAKAHPDRHTGANKSRAEGTSALINEAYKTLQDPLLRAQYLLSLHGIDVAEDETAKIDDPELLGEVLEVRERIENAEGEGEVEALKVENERKLEGSVKVLGRLCGNGDWDAAKSEAVRLRYWVNIREALRDWEPGKPVVLVH
jgi:molecular chaperone HscB